MNNVTEVRERERETQNVRRVRDGQTYSAAERAYNDNAYEASMQREERNDAYVSHGAYASAADGDLARCDRRGNDCERAAQQSFYAPYDEETYAAPQREYRRGYYEREEVAHREATYPQYAAVAYDSAPNREERRYAQQNPYTAASENKKTHKLNGKGKLLIAVYFLIVVVIATLILVNQFTGGNVAQTTAAADVNSGVTYDKAVVGAVVDADGNVGELQSVDAYAYEYAATSNWFDKMCDTLGKLFS